MNGESGPDDAAGDKAESRPAGSAGEAASSAQTFMRRLLHPPTALGGYRELGLTPLARQLGLAEHQLGGHWCSRCQGVWWGTALEVECPACGNRNG